MKKLLLSLVLVQGLVAAPIHDAVVKGDVDGVKKILKDSRREINSTDRLGRTALYIAAYSNHIKLVKLLLDFGADVNISTTFDSTPLHAASSRGNAGVVQLLIECGADVNVADKNGNTSVHMAVSKGHIDAICVLVKDALFNSMLKNHAGETATEMAKRKKYGEIEYIILGAVIISDEKKACMGKCDAFDMDLIANYRSKVTLYEKEDTCSIQ